MKIIISSVVALLATAAVATAQMSNVAINIVSGVTELGVIAPDHSICGVIGGFALIGVIGARRIRTKG
ncbi:MAG: hypothetical protein P8L44_17445 [Opitutales bacterium]|jgi:hypothetical protein|nr:hypothetical protein [Opitutales bacterium]MDG2169700.1 hypothetical protein [Opitutales bacterium]